MNEDLYSAFIGLLMVFMGVGSIIAENRTRVRVRGVLAFADIHFTCNNIKNPYSIYK